MLNSVFYPMPKMYAEKKHCLVNSLNLYIPNKNRPMLGNIRYTHPSITIYVATTTVVGIAKSLPVTGWVVSTCLLFRNDRNHMLLLLNNPLT